MGFWWVLRLASGAEVACGSLGAQEFSLSLSLYVALFFWRGQGHISAKVRYPPHLTVLLEATHLSLLP